MLYHHCVVHLFCKFKHKLKWKVVLFLFIPVIHAFKDLKEYFMKYTSVYLDETVLRTVTLKIRLLNIYNMENHKLPVLVVTQISYVNSYGIINNLTANTYCAMLA